MNFVRRHWAGDYSLSVSYWVFGLLIGLMAGLIAGAVQWLTLRSEYNPVRIIVTVLLVWSSLVAVSIWHLVGVWRAAGRRRAAGKPAFWGWAARLVTLLGVVQLGVTLARVATPQLAAMADIAFNGDSHIPNYTIAVTADGTEADISGGFKYGLAADLRRVLDGAPGVRVIDFTSVGGRIGEAKTVFRLIAARGLTTLTNTYCVSACALAFLGGTERWLGARARLGFHRGSFEGVSSSQVSAQEKGFFADVVARDGVPLAFLERTETIAPTDMWYPTRRELLANHVITRQTSPAASSLGKISAGLMVARDKMSATLPKQLDLVTRLVRVTVSGVTLSYVYEVASLEHSVFARVDVDERLGKKLRAAICGNQNMRQDVEGGVVYRYEYHLRDDATLLYEKAISACE